MTKFAVDLDDLDSTVSFMEKTSAAITQELTALDARIAALHDVWTGEAAAAQREAHQEWTAGATAMRAALDDMRAAARTAHTNYTNAITANQQMWS